MVLKGQMPVRLHSRGHPFGCYLHAHYRLGGRVHVLTQGQTLIAKPPIGTPHVSRVQQTRSRILGPEVRIDKFLLICLVLRAKTHQLRDVRHRYRRFHHHHLLGGSAKEMVTPRVPT